MSSKKLRKPFTKWWRRNVFKWMVYGSVVVLFLLWLVRDPNAKGTWSLEYDYAWDGAKGIKIGHESIPEGRCRAFLENRFRVPFPTVTPDFLKNSVTGKNLELDCYNEELKLAVEYNGRQHYEYTPHFHRSRAQFQNLQYRDEKKQSLCRRHGVHLIIVPYTEKNVEQYLSRELSRLGL